MIQGRVSIALRIALVGLLVGLAGCGAVVLRNPVPQDQAGLAQPLGMPNLRTWGDLITAQELDPLVTRQGQILRARFGAEMAAGRTPTLHYLAISGGGPDGAFGAGILRAWTATGTRPEFQGVSGVSTGAIIAPLAFLGPAYDGALEEIYTTLRTDDVLRTRILSGLISGVALTDTTGLANKIARYVTPDLLEKIAVEFRRGRVLLVGTTNLDAGRPMIWNMGAIAASGHPDALQLFRDVIRASAAIPIAFPPVFIKVQTPDGRSYDEMHVDGGASSQVMLISPQIPVAALTRRELGRNLDRRLWVLMNNQVLGEFEQVRPRVGAVGARAVSSLIRGSGIGDVYKLYLIAERDEIAFKASWIPPHVPCTANEAFDPVYMRCLMDFGAEQVRAGTAWHDLPPHFIRPVEQQPVRRGRPLALSR
jgi:predicted patatin/cPLA2 family phospholipase